MNKKIKKLFNWLLSLAFPPVCGICGKVNKENLCRNCEEELRLIKICKITNYNDEKTYYKEHCYLFKYEGIIRQKIIDFKFNDKSYLYNTFAKLILSDAEVCEYIKKYEVIIPVPISNKRKKERGYNQTVLIIKEVIEKLEEDGTTLIIDTATLLKIKNNVKQSALNRRQRENNVKNVYVINKESKLLNKIKDKKILIFDDIFTTGNTVNECAKVLQIISKKIGILTIAKD